jgi:hypothetical protein
VDLDSSLQTAIGRAGDDMTRLHLRDLRREIDKILNPESK